MAGAVLLVGCQTLPMPRGTRAGYESVRLISPDSRRAPSYSERKAAANRLVQEALVAEFREKGFRVDPANADLTVAYLIIAQDQVSTTSVSDYFGYGQSPIQITEAAHRAGVLGGKKRKYYEKGAIIVDIIDSKTKELVYRNYAVRDFEPSLSGPERAARVRGAVSEALRDFFRE